MILSLISLLLLSCAPEEEALPCPENGGAALTLADPPDAAVVCNDGGCTPASWTVDPDGWIAVECPPGYDYALLLWEKP